MDYKKLYREIILTAKKENRVKNSGLYYESHHIVPEFMFINRKRKGPKGHLEGDPNSESNLVLLTFKEHVLAHYYLYETLKGTRYEYSAGSALAFFFTKATDNKHIRWQSISELDEKFLDEMQFIREIGIKSISNARKGKMPVVDAITRQPIGSVSVDHPKVLSGEWIHHSKGITGRKMKDGWMSGSANANYRQMTDSHKLRIMNLVGISLVDDNYFSQKKFCELLRIEFSEFKKVSYRWILNNYGTWDNLVDTYNKTMETSIINNPYYRSVEQRKKYSEKNSSFWVTNGIDNKKVKKEEIDSFLEKNVTYKKGRTL